MTWEQYIKKNYNHLIVGGNWVSLRKADGSSKKVFIPNESIKKFNKFVKREETSSPVPPEWANEIRNALGEWRETVFKQGVTGLLKEKSRQKITKAKNLG